MLETLITINAVVVLAGAILAAWWLARLNESLRGQREALDRLERALREELALGRREAADLAQSGREEQAAALKAGQAATLATLSELGRAEREQIEALSLRVQQFGAANEQRFEALRAAVEKKLGELQADNARKLDDMRATVDEKLQAALEKRLGESFKLVSERLEQVHKGLGEMAAIASGVGDLKKVLGNVKTRGGWGEVQLGALLEQTLAPDQFARNVAVRPGSAERVEFALRLPGREQGEAPVWLPIDAKFPQEDYQRLVEAAERADAEAVEASARALEQRLRQFAREIREKYVLPPHTTDFALMFLPSEGLYAEALRRPGLADALQREHRVVIAGPTTLTALLNSLQMGFRTLAIQRRSSEVWQILGAVKTEFSRFGEALDKVKKKLDEASGHLEHTGVRTRAIERKLRGVEALPTSDTERLLPPTSSDDE